MRPTNRFSQIFTGALLVVAFFALIVPFKVQAQSIASSVPQLDAFVASVQDGEAGALRGVYVPNVMAFAIIQQPERDSGFVSDQSASVTQFRMASRLGNLGLLAHNTLAGKFFFNIPQGSQIILVYGDGHTETYVVDQIFMYQALPYGQYKNLQTQDVVDIGGLFNMAYGGEHHLTLQTCIESQGDFAWGRLFIIAKPLSKVTFTSPSHSPK